MEKLDTALGIFVCFSGIIGWIFKIWIINPLATAIAGIKDVITKLQEYCEIMSEKSEKQNERLAVLEQSVKAGHRRMDDMNNDIAKLERQQIECLKQRGEHNA